MSTTPAALDEAMRRSYAQARCVDYGCLPEDAQALHAAVSDGTPWLEAGITLGERHERRAQADPALARAALLAASACFRVAQPALEETPQQRLPLYRRAVSTFARALATDPQMRFLEVRHQGLAHAAWLFAPPQAAAQPGCVVIWGGADGWCEAFHGWVSAFHAFGLAVCLTELPGQGLARLQQGSFLSERFTGYVGTLLDALAVALGPPAGHFAVIGNSMGGSLALRAAADDARIRACVTNGGSVDLAAGLNAFPRVLQRICLMLGPSATPDAALRFISALDLPGASRAMRGALLCVHGGADPLVQEREVQALLQARPDTTLLRWPDGVHCVYNHAAERNRRVALWIAERLHKNG